MTKDGKLKLDPDYQEAFKAGYQHMGPRCNNPWLEVVKISQPDGELDRNTISYLGWLDGWTERFTGESSV